MIFAPGFRNIQRCLKPVGRPASLCLGNQNIWEQRGEVYTETLETAGPAGAPLISIHDIVFAQAGAGPIRRRRLRPRLSPGSPDGCAGQDGDWRDAYRTRCPCPCHYHPFSDHTGPSMVLAFS